jgi:UDP-galactopyranose mutase
MSHFDWLIVGAGVTGCTLAERLSAGGKRVLLIDRRPHMGGNCHDTVDGSGVLVQAYGPHIFHTCNEAVHDYLGQFTDWHDYAHHVEAALDGRFVPVPFNLNTLRELWPDRDGRRLERALLSQFPYGSEINVLRLGELSDFRDMADQVVDSLFEQYSQKQWGKWRKELDESVFSRVPVRVSRDNRYFTDTFQGVPSDGYTAMMRQMVLDSPRILVLLGQEFRQLDAALHYDRVLFTGRIDEFYEYSYGRLPYRSVNLEFETFRDSSVLQRTGTVNYPTLSPRYTRSTEFRIITGQLCTSTTVCREYPVDADATHEAMYPVPCGRSRATLKKYQRLAAREPYVRFCGRLGGYRYLNIDQAVESALDIAATIV